MSKSVCHHKSEKILANGFSSCQVCKVIILYECEHCFCTIRYKNANHNCCISDNEDEGLGPDLEDCNAEFAKINRRKLYYKDDV